MDNILTTQQIADKFNVERQTVSNWCKDGRLAGAFKAGRDWLIPESAFDQFTQPQRGRPTNGKAVTQV